jgi:hypothetical protein
MAYEREGGSGAAWIDDEPNVAGSSAWIERDQFVSCVTMAHELGHPHHWPVFRDELVAALRAAWGIDAIWLHLDPAAQRARRSARLALAYEILDAVREQQDPAADWDRFMDALWAARRSLTGAASANGPDVADRPG